MANLTIRDYTPADLDAVLRLDLDAWPDRDAPEARGAADAPDLQEIEAVYQRDGAFLVCVDDDGVMLGMVGLQRHKGRVYEMRRMRVVLSAQRRGIGRRLVEAVEQRARALGATQIVLQTTLQQLGAQRLYEACGYELTHTSVLQDAHARFDVMHYRKLV